ncbi:uncharacterized protein LOC135834612 isoform X2 [Planococcus citri]|uniref:uncharacterized protein LOC135834612 isoform X2 n=1 Tax=Planococcus citri TaxID=170843 RepID=UPI0031F9BD0A
MNQETINTKESLRKNTIVLLYLSLIGNIWGLITAYRIFNNLSYKQFLHDEISILLDFALLVIGSMIFFNTYVAIYNHLSSSVRLLWMAIIFSLLDAFYMIYGLIQMHSNNDVREVLFNISRQREVAKVIQAEQSSYWFPMESFSSSMLVVIVSLVIGIAFKLYSALIFHIYKLLLQRWPNPGATAPQNDSCAPSIYTVQVSDSHCMSQFPQYLHRNPSFMRRVFSPAQKTPQYYFQPRMITHVPLHASQSQFASKSQTPRISSTIPNQCQCLIAPLEYINQSPNIPSSNPN